MAPSNPAPAGSTTPTASEPSAPVDPPPTGPLAEALRLADAGDLPGAVDLLAAANRADPDPDLQVALVDLRRRAAKATDVPLRDDWPPQYADPFPEVVGVLPEVAAADLTLDVMGGAVQHHGALIVRDLFSPDEAQRTRDAIDTAHRHREAAEEEGAAPSPVDYRPLPTDEPMRTAVMRSMVEGQGGIWLADSPSATAVALDALHDVGAVDMMTEHFGHRPHFSLQKSTLRRSAPKLKIVAWHQDGSFYDPDVRTMNVWVALSPCGGDRPTPGLEVYPKRMEEILPVFGDPTPHSIDFALVDELAKDTPTIVPEFEPGDALMFDEHFLHRTYLPREMTDPRYALECWFFAPSRHTSDYVPLLA